MFGKNRNKKVGLCVMVVTSCFILAALWAILATPETALAKKPDGVGGGGEKLSVHYWLSFQDTLHLFWESDCPRIGRISSDPIMWNRIQGFGVGGDPLLTVANLPGVSDDPDFATCFPEGSYGGTMSISADGTEVKMTFGARSKSGGPLQYNLIMTVVERTLNPWEPLGLAGGDSATLLLGDWVLKPASGPARKGCVGSGDFASFDSEGNLVSDLAITVTRFTDNEEIVGKDDPSSLVPPDPCP
ncbi:MAG: hypothetical protein ACYS9C_00200 [Planctomycetota bacterium]